MRREVFNWQASTAVSTISVNVYAILGWWGDVWKNSRRVRQHAVAGIHAERDIKQRERLIDVRPRADSEGSTISCPCGSI